MLCVCLSVYFQLRPLPNTMSDQVVEQEEIEEARLSTPRLDFTGRVHSILDGDESILSPNTEIPSVPDDIVDMDIQSLAEENNNDGIVQNNSNVEEVEEENNGNLNNESGPSKTSGG